MACYVEGDLINEVLKKVATQYRDSCNFQDFVKVYLEDIEDLLESLCQIEPIDIDRLGGILNFPRCFCNIKKKKWFGFQNNDYQFFGFDYPVGEEPTEGRYVANSCLRGLSESRWRRPSDPYDCLLPLCCSVEDATVLGFCEGSWNCGKYPQHEDYCFDDDIEYTKLLKLKILSDNSDHSTADVLLGAQLLFGEQTTLFGEGNATITLQINRVLTDHEQLLIDFFKLLLPTAIGVKVVILQDGDKPHFGFTNALESCLGSRIAGFCEGSFLRRY